MLAFLSKKSYPAPRRTTTRLTRSTTVEGPRIALPPSITQLTLILTSLADVAGCALVTFALVEVIGAPTESIRARATLCEGNRMPTRWAPAVSMSGTISFFRKRTVIGPCLLYTSDAADE